MRNLNNKLTSGKNTRNTQSRRGKSFGYQVLGFGSGGGVPFIGTCDFLVVAGGGGNAVGQGGNREAGSGAGGLRTSFGSTSGGGASAQSQLTLTQGAQYTATIGAGGSGHSAGAASSFSGPDISTVSTSGGGEGSDGDNRPGGSGGSCGGGWYSGGAGGSGTSGEGYPGSVGFSGNPYGGAGGGAAGAGGRDTANGPGLAVSITGASVTYAVGGESNQFPSTSRNANGAANTGTGASGQGTGGSGVVILRVPTTDYTGTTTGSPTISTDGDFTVIKFTASGTYTS